MARPRVIILGGGFAGIKCARTLRKAMSPEQLEVVLFNRENHMVFHPLLAEVAGGSVAADAVAAPLRQMLPRVQCRTEEIQQIDLERRVVVFEGYDGKPRELSYEHVALAPGSIVNLGLVPGMSDHSFPLKTIGDAVTLRVQVMEQFEKAEVCDDPEHRRFLLSFIIVGGGYSGVEAAGEINQLARGSVRYFHNIRPEDIKVSLIHSRNQILPEISPSLLCTTRCARFPRISSRQVRSNPFITESTTMISHTPAAIPPTQIAVMAEMNTCRRLATR